MARKKSQSTLHPLAGNILILIWSLFLAGSWFYGLAWVLAQVIKKFL